MKMLLQIFAILVLFTSTCLHAEQFARNGLVPAFSNEDTVIFVGDSITHGGAYHTNIALFNALRYPSKKISYINAGISGDTAYGTNLRFERDIAIHKPDIATIMLGMNDVGGYLYEAYPKTDTEKSARANQQELIRNKYLKEMHKLASQLKAIDAEIIFIKPSIYDETADLSLPPALGRNDELEVYGEELLQLAQQFDANVVDFQRPMLKVNALMQAKDPSNSIVGNDRVHPGAAGHLVMAYAFLKAQNESSLVSDISLNVSRRMENSFINCELIGEVLYTRSRLEFSCKQLSLPFPLSIDQKYVLNWLPFQQELNQMRFSVSQLAKGQYTLTIDGLVVGDFDASQLDKGLNLSNYPQTPIYQQSLRVKGLNDERARLARKIRDIAHVSYSMLDKYPEVDRSDPLAVKEILGRHVEKSVGKPWYGYLKKQIKNYLSNYENVHSYQQSTSLIQAQIYVENQPKIYTWSLVKNTNSKAN
jgi:endoglucanase